MLCTDSTIKLKGAARVMRRYCQLVEVKVTTVCPFTLHDFLLLLLLYSFFPSGRLFPCLMASLSHSEQGVMQGTIPYLGTFLTDLVMMDTAMKDYTEVGYFGFLMSCLLFCFLCHICFIIDVFICFLREV